MTNPVKSNFYEQKIPSSWLFSVLKLLDVMAGDEITIEDCETPANLIISFAQYIGCDTLENPYEDIMKVLCDE